jgi:hypothetical protein
MLMHFSVRLGYMEPTEATYTTRNCCKSYIHSHLYNAVSISGYVEDLLHNYLEKIVAWIPCFNKIAGRKSCT